MSSRRGTRRPSFWSWPSLAFGSLAGLCALLGVHAAAAQTDDAAAAQALFDDAKKAMEAGDLATACPKFAESQRLDAGTGTLTGLALCHEKQGKYASAWAEFLEAAMRAQRANQADRAAFATQHASDLEPKLSKLTITVDPATAQLPGLTVTRDDKPVGQATWGVALPVDPGTHTIEAVATGKQKFTTQIELGDDADSKAVTIPPLADAPPAIEEKPEGAKPDEIESATPAPDSGNAGKRTAGLVVGGVGVASLVIGTIFGIEAISQSSQAKQGCVGSDCTNPNSVNTMNSAKTSAVIADVGFVGAVALGGIGAFLFFTSQGGGAASRSAPASAPASRNMWQLTPFVGTNSGGAAVIGTF